MTADDVIRLAMAGCLLFGITVFLLPFLLWLAVELTYNLADLVHFAWDYYVEQWRRVRDVWRRYH